MDLQNLLADLKIQIATSSFAYEMINRVDKTLNSETMVNALFVLKAAGLLVTLVMIYLVIFIIIKTNLIGTKLLPLKIILNRPNQAKDATLAAEMARVKKRIEQKNPSEDRLAVLAACQLLERGLAKMGKKNALFRENVEAIPYWSLTTSDKIFFAYNLRTKLVHNPREQVSHEEAQEAVEIFEKALQDLGQI